MMHPRHRRHPTASYLALPIAALLSSACEQEPQTVSGLQCGPHPQSVDDTRVLRYRAVQRE